MALHQKRAEERERGSRRVVAAGVALLIVLALLALGLLTLAAGPARAHGVVLEERTGEAVEVAAAFDNGEPMREAQVTVYAPEDPAEPWATGVTDGRGRYAFFPDGEQSGTWSVQVRQAGHGATTSVEVPGEGGTAEPVETERTSGGGRLQTGLVAAFGLWGFIGTALFFMRRRG